MDLRKLKAAAEALERADTGKWLIEEFEKLGHKPDSLKILVLTSNRCEFNLIAPARLRDNHQWRFWDNKESVEELKQAVVDSDLLIWLMSALKLFPADYAVALETACSKQLPVWAIVNGQGLLSDRAEFIKTIIPHNKDLLPECSEIFLIDEADNNPLKDVASLLEEKGNLFAEAGHKRRSVELAKNLKRKLLDERRELRNSLGQSLRLTEIAQLGIESLLVTSGAASSEIIDDHERLYWALDELQDSLLSTLDKREGYSSSDELWAVIENQLNTWRSENLEKELETNRTEAEQKIAAWCAESTGEIRKFFSPFTSMKGVSAEFLNAVAFDPRSTITKISPLIADLERQLLHNFDSFKGRLEKDIRLKILRSLGQTILPRKRREQSQEETIGRESEGYYAYDGGRPGNNEPPEREPDLSDKVGKVFDTLRQAVGIEDTRMKAEENRIMTILSDNIRLVKESLVNITKLQREKCKDILGQIIQEQANACFNTVIHTVSDPQSKLKKISEAEALLGIG